MIYIEIINGQITQSTPFEFIGSKFENFITTDYEDYTPSNNKYLYDADTNSIVLNPNYEQEEEEKRRQAHIAELKEQLNEIDSKSARSLRAIIAGTATDTDRAYLAELERQAEEIRGQL